MPIYCGKCLRSYTRKENWEKHFNQKTYKTDGFGHAANVCFNLEKGHPRVYDTTPEKAKTKYQSALQFKNTFNFKRAHSEDSSVGQLKNTFKRSQSEESRLPPSKKVATEAEADTEPECESSQECRDESDSETNADDQDGDEKGDPNDGDCGDDDNEDLELCGVPVTSKHIPEKTEVSESKIDQLFSLISSLQKSQEENHAELLGKFDGFQASPCPSTSAPSRSSDLKSSTESNSSSSKSTMAIEADEQFVNSMLSLKHATSMRDIMSNPLIQDAFKLRVPNESEEGGQPQHELYCVGCSDKSLRGLQGCKVRASSFKVADPEYKTQPNMPRWFSNLKMALRRHCEHISHHQLTTSYNLLKRRKFQTTSTIRRMRLNIMYYIMKTNSPFTLYPILLAVLSRCGIEVGNKNYSRSAVPKILDLLGK